MQKFTNKQSKLIVSYAAADINRFIYSESTSLTQASCHQSLIFSGRQTTSIQTFSTFNGDRTDKTKCLDLKWEELVSTRTNHLVAVSLNKNRDCMTFIAALVTQKLDTVHRLIHGLSLQYILSSFKNTTCFHNIYYVYIYLFIYLFQLNSWYT